MLSMKTLDTFVKSGINPIAKNPPPSFRASFRTNTFAVKFTGPTANVSTPPPAVPAKLSMKVAFAHVKLSRNWASIAPPKSPAVLLVKLECVTNRSSANSTETAPPSNDVLFVKLVFLYVD